MHPEDSSSSGSPDQKGTSGELRQKFGYSAFILLASFAMIAATFPDVSLVVAVCLIPIALVLGVAMAIWRPPTESASSGSSRVALGAAAYGGAVLIFIIVDDNSDLFYVGVFTLLLAAYFFTLSFIDLRAARRQSPTTR